MSYPFGFVSGGGGGGTQALTTLRDGVSTPRNTLKKISDALDLFVGNPKPLRLGTIGDSRLAPDGTLPNPDRKAAHGIASWIEFSSFQRVRLDKNACFATAGHTSQQVLDLQLAQAIAQKPDVLVALFSVNDATGVDSVGNFLTGVNAAADAGIRVLAYPELPRHGGSWSATRLQQHHSVGDALRNLNRPGVLVPDPWPYLLDTRAALSDRIRPNVYNADGIHPLTWGAFYAGREGAKLLNALLPRPRLLTASWGGGWNASYRRRNLTPNPGFVATGSPAGTLSPSGNTPPLTFTGTVPDSTIITLTGTGVTVVGRVVEIDSLWWLEFDLSGTPGGTADQLEIRQNLTSANFSVGDVVEALCAVQVDAGATGIRGPTLRLSTTGGSNQSPEAMHDTWPTTDRGPCPPVFHEGVQCTYPLTIVSGMTAISHRVVVRFQQGVAVSGRFRIACPNAYIVN